MAVDAARAGRPGRERHDRPGVDGAGAAPVRPHRRDRQLLLHRAVVSQARRASRTSGWNTHQFHAATEFFSDYGVYDVRLTVPRAGWSARPACSSARATNGDGTATHRYYQEDVHDFAWTTSPDYIERRPGSVRACPALPRGRDAAADPARARRPGRPPLRRDARRRSSSTANGSAPIRTTTSPSSIRPFRATPTAWSTRRSSPPARVG